MCRVELKGSFTFFYIFRLKWRKVTRFGTIMIRIVQLAFFFAYYFFRQELFNLNCRGLFDLYFLMKMEKE